jgi:hypothetical protein
VSAVPFKLKTSDQFPLGGRLRHFLPFWRRVTADPFILKTIIGVEVPFLRTPVQSRPTFQYNFNEHDASEVRREILWMLEQQIVKRVDPQPDQFVSPFFLATNADKTKRPILNVNEINEDFTCICASLVPHGLGNRALTKLNLEAQTSRTKLAHASLLILNRDEAC